MSGKRKGPTNLSILTMLSHNVNNTPQSRSRRPWERRAPSKILTYFHPPCPSKDERYFKFQFHLVFGLIPDKLPYEHRLINAILFSVLCILFSVPCIAWPLNNQEVGGFGEILKTMLAVYNIEYLQSLGATLL